MSSRVAFSRLSRRDHDTPTGNRARLDASLLSRPVPSVRSVELFKEVAPKAARLGHLVNPNNPFFSLYIRSVEIGAQAFRVELQRVEVRAPEDFDGAFMEIGRLRSDALLVQPDVLIVSQRSRVVEFAAKNRLPAVRRARVRGGWRVALLLSKRSRNVLSRGLTIPQSLLLRADHVIQ